SIVGPRRLQGPHHSAQKSTSTGVPACSTDESKLPSVNVCTLSAAIHRSLRNCPIVYFDVLLSRTVPGMIGFHSSDLQRPPTVSILEKRQRTVKGVEKGLRGVVLEDEAVWPARSRPCRRQVGHRIGESADASNDGNGPVPQAVHLV